MLKFEKKIRRQKVKSGRMLQYRPCEISSALKVEEMVNSETSVRVCRTEQRCISEDIECIFIHLPVHNTKRYALVEHCSYCGYRVIYVKSYIRRRNVQTAWMARRLA